MPEPKNEIMQHNNVKITAAPVYLVNYTDGRGKNETKVALILGEEIRFLADGGLSKPIQQWLANDILIALGMRSPDTKTEPQVEKTPVEANLDSQI